tara:strand:- start:1168 stop:1473 length:306 start_codon:yes stop_codon:yes gene_type:complete
VFGFLLIRVNNLQPYLKSAKLFLLEISSFFKFFPKMASQIFCNWLFPNKKARKQGALLICSQVDKFIVDLRLMPFRMTSWNQALSAVDVTFRARWLHPVSF